MNKILVTGANKGIGYAIVEGILKQAEDTFVFLGSRDPARGHAAAEKIQMELGLTNRIQVVQIDVASDDSVNRACAEIRQKCDGESLFGIVNNAGMGIGSDDLASVLNVNVRGHHRVCTAFIPLLVDGGRIVNVTSASGPTFVAKCSEKWQRFFTDTKITWHDIDDFMQTCIDIAGQAKTFSELGLSTGTPYELSKACANAYMLHLAREYPQLIVNACTPGFIATDLTRKYELSRNQTVEEMGAKTPREGAKSTLFLLFEDPDGSGYYYGSDAKRSPLDRYRAPGSPPYNGK